MISENVSPESWNILFTIGVWACKEITCFRKSGVITNLAQKIEMDNLQIRLVKTEDIISLQEIGKQTFYETFSSLNNEKNMQGYLKKSFSTKKLQEELVDPYSEFYFALLDNKIIGYLKVNIGQSQTEIKDENSLEIERIYVLKEYQGKKAGQFLYDKAIAIARSKKVNYVWLGVWEKNLRAIAFYKKNGFVEFNKHVFTLGEDKQTDIMMQLRPI